MKVRILPAAMTALSLCAMAGSVLAQDEGGDAVFGEPGLDDSTYDDDIYGDGAADDIYGDGGDAAAVEDGGTDAAADTEYAFEGEERQLEEVVVTVERREQNLQDLGGTATTFNSEELKQYGASGHMY